MAGGSGRSGSGGGEAARAAVGPTGRASYADRHAATSPQQPAESSAMSQQGVPAGELVESQSAEPVFPLHRMVADGGLRGPCRRSPHGADRKFTRGTHTAFGQTTGAGEAQALDASGRAPQERSHSGEGE